MNTLTRQLNGLVRSLNEDLSIYLPAGTYEIDDEIGPIDGVHIEGAGTDKTRLVRKSSSRQGYIVMFKGTSK